MFAIYLVCNQTKQFTNLIKIQILSLVLSSAYRRTLQYILHWNFTRAQERCMGSLNKYRKPRYQVRASVKAIKVIRGVMCKVLGLISGLFSNSNTCGGLVGWACIWEVFVTEYSSIISHLEPLKSASCWFYLKKKTTHIFTFNWFVSVCATIWSPFYLPLFQISVRKMMGGLSQRKHKTTGRRSTEERKGGDLKEGRGGQRD